MKKPGLLLKTVTVASSITLVSGCIAYRSGALNSIIPSRSPASSAASAAAKAQPPAANDSQADARVASLLFMSGTKSDAGVTGSIVAAELHRHWFAGEAIPAWAYQPAIQPITERVPQVQWPPLTP